MLGHQKLATIISTLSPLIMADVTSLPQCSSIRYSTKKVILIDILHSIEYREGKFSWLIWHVFIQIDFKIPSVTNRAFLAVITLDQACTIVEFRFQAKLRGDYQTQPQVQNKLNQFTAWAVWAEAQRKDWIFCSELDLTCSGLAVRTVLSET